MKRRTLAVLGLVLASSGCGDDAVVTDAGSPDAAVDGGLPSTVDIPWLADGMPAIVPPTFTPCPSGWREVATAGAPPTCEPYPEAGAKACPAGQAHFVGEPACADVGSPCPAGDWPADLPSSGVVYARAGAAAGGDGSLAAPFARIADALRGASVGTVVAVAKGRYAETLGPPPGVTIVGACAAETLIAPTSLGTATATVTATRVGMAHLRDIGIVSSPGYGVRVNGSSAELELDGVEIVAATGCGLLIEEGAHVVARSLVVRDTRSTAASTLGRAVSLQDAARAEISRAVVSNNRQLALYVGGPGSTLVVEDIVVRDTQSQASDRRTGWGLSAEGGATADASRALLERNHGVGVFASDPDSTVRLTDTIVRDTLPQESDGHDGNGVIVKRGASGELRRVLVERSRTSGVVATEGGAFLSIEDLVVRDTMPDETDGTIGRGLSVFANAGAVVSRAIIEHSRDLGLFVSEGDTMVELTDVVVRDTEGSPDGTGGIGLDVQLGAGARVSRMLLERNRAIGILVDGVDTTITLSDVVVRDTDSQMSNGAGGRGLDVQQGATADVTRMLIERNRENGVYVGVAGTTVTLSNVIVRETSLPRCSPTTCTGLRPAVGIGSYGAVVDVRAFLIDCSELCGVQIGEHLGVAGALDLHHGLVRRSDIGACVQVDGYDLARLQDDVAFVEVRRPLETTTLPVPDPSPPVGR